MHAISRIRCQGVNKENDIIPTRQVHFKCVGKNSCGESFANILHILSIKYDYITIHFVKICVMPKFFVSVN